MFLSRYFSFALILINLHFKSCHEMSALFLFRQEKNNNITLLINAKKKTGKACAFPVSLCVN